MHPGIRAARLQTARERIEHTAGVLAARFDLAGEAAALVNAGDRDPELETLFRLEAAADLLDALDRATVLAKPAAKRKAG